jgi:hypothetical protein
MHGSFKPDGRCPDRERPPQRAAGPTPDDDPREVTAPDIRAGTREWWERYWTDALEGLKRYLEEGEGI